MTYRELEKLIFALSIEDAARLLGVLQQKLESSSVGEQSARYIVEEGRDVMEPQVQRLLERLAGLPPERQAEVRDFIEFLHHQERGQPGTADFARASESSFAQVWDNDDDALYDKL